MRKIKLIMLLSLAFQEKKLSQPINPDTKTRYDVQDVLFSPNIQDQSLSCTDGIIETIQKAQTEILIQAYSFTSQKITNSLLEALKKGVKITIIIDRTYANKPCIQHLYENGAEIYIDMLKSPSRQNSKGIAHNKIMIIDKKYIITGSFNFTEAAQHRNTENITIMQASKANNKFVKNFLSRKAASTKKTALETTLHKSKNKRFKNKHKNKYKLPFQLTRDCVNHVKIPELVAPEIKKEKKKYIMNKV